jgi:GntR family histidine utilization transcriptional repressor
MAEPARKKSKADALPAPGPLYARVKRYIAERIDSGAWPEDHRVPSEHELVREFGVSRMTVHRALRELTAQGALIRIQGVGTFVAAAKPQSALVQIRNIADEIRERGHRHSAEVHLLASERADPELAGALGLPSGAEIYHSILVHRENDVPVQLEDRYVNPSVAPDYVDQNFTTVTPNEFLMRVAPLAEVEHIIEAVMPDAATRRRLEMADDEPCLLLRRRTWSGGAAASSVRLLHPGSRYRLGGRFTYKGAEGALHPQPQESEEVT